MVAIADWGQAHPAWLCPCLVRSRLRELPLTVVPSVRVAVGKAAGRSCGLDRGTVHPAPMSIPHRDSAQCLRYPARGVPACPGLPRRWSHRSRFRSGHALDSRLPFLRFPDCRRSYLLLCTEHGQGKWLGPGQDDVGNGQGMVGYRGKGWFFRAVPGPSPTGNRRAWGGARRHKSRWQRDDPEWIRQLCGGDQGPASPVPTPGKAWRHRPCGMQHGGAGGLRLASLTVTGRNRPACLSLMVGLREAVPIQNTGVSGRGNPGSGEELDQPQTPPGGGFSGS